MNTAAALGAARRLSVDVANLSYRLALADAAQDTIRETLVTVAPDGTALKIVEPDLWQRRMVGEDPVRVEIVLTEEQAAAVVNIITTLESVL